MRKHCTKLLSYVLAVSLLVVSALSGLIMPIAAESTGVILGGDFEAPMSDAIYNTNWVDGVFADSETSPMCTIVEEANGNHCLKVPLYTDGAYYKYLKGLNLEPNTSYTLSLDARGGGVWVYIDDYGIIDAPGPVCVGGSDDWEHYEVVFLTGDNADGDLASFVNWGMAFIRNPSYEETVVAETYIDNFKLEVTPAEEPDPVQPNMSVENEKNYVKGGSFEYPQGNSIYDENFAMLDRLSIVQDPKNSDNNCLYIPQSPAADYYFTNLKLQPSTTYVFEFDVLNTGTAGVYFWGSGAYTGNDGLKAIPASSEWQHVKYELTTTDSILENSAYPNWLFAFMKTHEPYNESDMYVDNVSVTVKQKEAPTVKPLVTGGNFEDTSVLSENWGSILDKGNVVEDIEIDGNYCLKLPQEDSPIGDAYVNNLMLEPNTTYFVTFDARGGAARVYFYPNAFLENGVKPISKSTEWRSYGYKVTTGADAYYLANGYQNWLIGFSKTDAETNSADTYIDNFRIVKAGAYVDPDLKNGSVTLSSWKEPEVIGAQVTPAAGGTVTVTVTPDEGYMLKPGSLYYVTEDGAQRQILNKESGGFGEGVGNVFRFVMPEGSVVVTAEFVPVAAQNFRFETLGTSVYYEQGANDPNGLRFLNRMYVADLDLSSDTMTVIYNGQTYTVAEFGSLIKRATNSAELTLENVDDSASSANRVWKAVAYDGATMKLVDYTENYVDFTVIMKTAVSNESFLTREYIACGYMILSDGTNSVTLYSKVKTDSAEKTAERSAPMPEKDDDWRSHPQDFKLIATTFDRPDFTDGTGRMESIIEALYALDGSATINVAGESLAEGSTTRDSQIALLSDAISKGFEIGSYTWNNDTWGYSPEEFDTRTEEDFMTYLGNTQTVIQETLGVTPEFVRPPLLMWNDKVANVCEELGLSIVTGNVSWRDFPAGYNLEESGSATYESLTTHAHDGAIWSLHAHSSDTPAAFISTLPVLYEQGYRFCTVAELLEYSGQTRVAGVNYNEIFAVY